MKKIIALARSYGRKARVGFAKSLGVDANRKAEVYLDVSRAASLRDIVYWLQIIFSAGIATMGLVLNSPAVIIGAMLISPLMGPILAAGLALATGDLVLGLRSAVSLAVSCVVAISIAVFLVALLPFKELTGEIAGRTQPNTLDLMVALFSGAVGSVALCREVKGVVTSIPGVAIAVALMPPLCVVGYGVGLALSFDLETGIRTASGGGLMFVTNLVAITFTAMIVFVLLHIDISSVKEKAEAWRASDRESAFVQRLLHRLPSLEKAGQLRSLPLRLLMILLPMAVIFIPLSRSFSQLNAEIKQKQAENVITQKATDLWQQYFANTPNGEARSSIDQLSVTEADGKLQVLLRVVDTKPYTGAEQAEYARLLASHLNRPAGSVNLQLIEIPTTAALLGGRTKEEKKAVAPTVTQLQANFLQSIETSLSELRLPPPARLVNKKITSAAGEPLLLELVYLSERDIEIDGQALILEAVRSRLGSPNALVSYQRLAPDAGVIEFVGNQTALQNGNAAKLDEAGRVLKSNPRLGLELTIKTQADEPGDIGNQRAQAVMQQLETKWQIARERVQVATTPNTSARALLRFQIAEVRP